MLKKRIAVFTSIRSEYGLLSPLLKKLKNHPTYELELLVGGAHVSRESGMTIDKIREDGFDIKHIFDFLCLDDRPDSVTKSVSKLQDQMGEYLSVNPPDLMIVLGDRFELLPVAIACTLFNIPLAHISGGEITEGAQDNQFRHALTKLAHVHFPATEMYKENILKMGEEDWRVCVSGEPGLDLLTEMNFIPKEDLYKSLKLDTSRELIICTFHPETISKAITAEFVKNTLVKIIAETKFQILVTAANFDEGGKAINQMLEELALTTDRLVFITNLGQQRYYSILKYASLMLGNSSSGLVEAQSFNLPVINVGNRQLGRMVNPNVFDCLINEVSVIEAIKNLKSDSIKNKYFQKANIYGDGKACERIIEYLDKMDFNNLCFKKTIFR